VTLAPEHSPEQPSPPPLPASHYGLIADQMMRGRVTPFLGAGANKFGRPDGFVYHERQFEYLPDGGELADVLARRFHYPENEIRDLVRVSQFAQVMVGGEDLYNELRALFAVNYPLRALHTFFARLPRVLREKGFPPSYQLIVTTNYDDTLERAFGEAEEEFDVIYYSTEADGRGIFRHRKPDGDDVPIEAPNTYDPTLLSQRPVILKIHGAVNRDDPNADCFVITEDDYINYLAHNDLSNLVPNALKRQMATTHFLFLGYSMRDWNLRAFLHRIWAERKRTSKSWAIQLDVDELDREFWAARDVNLLVARLEDYIAELSRRLDALPPAGG
jgi:hypothetical protein